MYSGNDFLLDESGDKSGEENGEGDENEEWSGEGEP